MRGGRNLGTSTSFPTAVLAEPEEALSSFLMQYYGACEPPREVYVNLTLPDAGPLAAALAGRAGRQVDVSRPARGLAARWVALTAEKAAQALRMRRAQRDALRVRDGINGVLQSVPVEVGQQVSPGTNLARVVEPTRLKAVIRVAETQAKDLAIGLPCEVDTRNGVVKGRVVRIDPAAQNGTVAVDVSLEGDLPKGARPDLTVDGTTS